MSLATMFQDKSREVALATALLIGAAGIYNNNAQADTQAVNHSAPTTTQTAPDDDVMDAANYAKEHNTVAIWICAPPNLAKTPQQLAEISEKGFQRMGIPEAKGFSAVSESAGNRIIIFVGDEPYINPTTGARNFDIHNIKGKLRASRLLMTQKIPPSGTGVEAPSLTFQPRNNR